MNDNLYYMADGIGVLVVLKFLALLLPLLKKLAKNIMSLQIYKVNVIGWNKKTCNMR